MSIQDTLLHSSQIAKHVNALLSIQDTLLHASQIAKHVHALYDSPDYKISSDWKGHYPSGPNPYYYQTEQGIFIEETAGGSPSYLWTPLGRWTILGSIFVETENDIKKIRDKLFEYVDVDEFEPAPTCKYPDRGAIWTLFKYD